MITWHIISCFHLQYIFRVGLWLQFEYKVNNVYVYMYACVYVLLLLLIQRAEADTFNGKRWSVVFI